MYRNLLGPPLYPPSQDRQQFLLGDNPLPAAGGKVVSDAGGPGAHLEDDPPVPSEALPVQTCHGDKLRTAATVVLMGRHCQAPEGETEQWD